MNVRRVRLEGNRTAFGPVRPIRSFVPTADADPVDSRPSSIAQGDDLVVAVYDVAGDAQSTDSVRNHGGALVLDVNVQLIFAGERWVDNDWLTYVVDAVQEIFASPYLEGLAQYGFRSVALRGVTLVTDPIGYVADYTFDDVAQLVWQMIDEDKFPDPGDDGGRIVYMVFMPPDSTPPAGVRGQHGDPQDGGLFPVDKAWIGFVSYGSIEHMTSVFTHQLVEAITDPEPDAPAWLMTRSINGGSEIGDACNNTVDRLDGSATQVQAYWSEAQKACVIPKGRGTVARLTSVQSTIRMQGGTSAALYVALDRPTTIDVSIDGASDREDLVSCGGTIIERGQQNGGVWLLAVPVAGPEQTVAVHVSYNGVTLTAEVTVTPAPSVVVGLVVDENGRGIAGAVVGIDNAASGGEINLGLLTNGEGYYETPTLPPGPYTVEITASGYVGLTDTLVVTEGVPSAEADWRLETEVPAIVAGTVTDAAGSPIAGAQVLLQQQNLAQRLTATTDDTGAYSVTVTPFEFYTGDYWLSVTQPGFAAGFLALAIPNGATLTENFTLSALGLLEGVVTDAHTGSPIALAYLKAAITAPDPLVPTSITNPVDASGRYQFQLPPGPVELTTECAGYEVSSMTVTVAAGATIQQDFPLVPASATLVCTVTDSRTGNPIGRSRVRVSGAPPERATGEGTHTVDKIPSGPQQVYITAQGYENGQMTVTFTAGQTDTTDITLDPTGSGPDPFPH